MPPTIVRGQWGQWGTGNFDGAVWKSPGGAIGIDYGSGPEVVPAGQTLGDYLRAVGGTPSAFHAWTTGGTYDPGRREFRTMATGGHWAFPSNEVNVLSWVTGLWNGGAGNPSRPVNPSVGLYRKKSPGDPPSADSIWPAGSYVGGTNVNTGPPAFWDLANRYTAGAKVPPGNTHALWPNGRQQYGSLVFMTSLGRYAFWNGTTFWDPRGGYVPFEFDPATNQYDGIIEETVTSYLAQGHTSCWDSTNTRMLHLDQYHLYAYRPTLPRGSRCTLVASDMRVAQESYYTTALWDPFRLRLQLIGYAENFYLDFSGGASSPIKRQPGSGGIPAWTIPGGGNPFGVAPMAVYDPISHNYFVWVGGGPAGQCDNTVYWFNPDTFVITTEHPPQTTGPGGIHLPQSSGDVGAAVGSNTGGLWNRGFYEPTDDVFAVVGNVYTQGFDFFAPRRTGATVTRSVTDSVTLTELLQQLATQHPAPGAPPIVNINLTQPPGLSASIRRAGSTAIPPQLVTDALGLGEQLTSLKINVPTGIPPVLFFSTIVQGPKAGNSDDSHGKPINQDGAYVSIYGKRISSLDFSLTINGAAAFTFYRGPAIPPYSQANLQNGVQSYEMIVAQVSHLATDGDGSIIATVDGVASNALPFKVAPGQIRYAKAGGNPSWPGTWQAPVQTAYQATDPMQPGDVTYLCTGSDQPTGILCPGGSVNSSAQIAIVGYPGHTVQLGDDTHAAVLNDIGMSGYWMTYANLRLGGAQDSTYNVVLKGVSRAVGNLFTAPNGTGKAAALGVVESAVQVVGNEFTTVGNVNAPDSEYHVIYVFGQRGRGPGSGNGAPGWYIEEEREIAYNFIHECKGALRAVNIYNGESSGYGSTAEGSNPIRKHRVHDNYIRGQHGTCIAFLTGVVGENWAYNNVLERNLFTPPVPGSPEVLGLRLRAGWDPARFPTAGNILHVWNNTIVDCGVQGNYSGAMSLETNYGWVPDIHSNLSYQVNGQPHVAPTDVSSPSFTPAPGQGHHNLWYGAAKPTWDATGVTGHPLFVAAGVPLNPRLQTASAARGVGAVLGAGQVDMDGVPRPTSAACDAGAFQYA